MQKLGVLALALGAAPVALGAERKQRVLIPDRARMPAFADVSLMGGPPAKPPPAPKPGAKPPAGSPSSSGSGSGETAAWWLPPASAYIAAGVPAASLGVYGNAASMPTVAGTYTPYPYYTPSAGFPGDAAGYPYYGYYPSAPFAAVAGAPSGYTNVYSMLSGAYRFRAGGGEEGGAAAGGGMPPRFAQADLKEGAAAGAGVNAEAMKAYHAHATGMLASDAHAAALASGYAHPAWTDFAHADAAAAEQQQHGEARAASAYSAAQRAHVMRMMAEQQTESKAAATEEAEAEEGAEQEAEEVVVPAAAAKAAPAAAAAAHEEEAISGAALSRSAIDEEIKSLEALAASI